VTAAELGRVYGAQELHELVTDLSRGFVLYPVAYIAEFETPTRPGRPARIWAPSGHRSASSIYEYTPGDAALAPRNGA
jgi:hypothetical protein